MIVQCDECNAKFRLDDSKVKEGGTKVRCSKCKHIFLVQKESSAEEPDFDSFLNGLVPPPEAPGKLADAVAPTAGQQAAEAPEPSNAAGSEAEAGKGEAPLAEKEEFDFGEFAFDTEAGTSPGVPADTDHDGGFDIDVDLDFGPAEKRAVSFDADASTPGAPQERPSDHAAPSFDFDAFSFSEEPVPSVAPTAEAGRGAAPVDFDAASFDEEPLQSGSEKEETSAVAQPFDFDTFSIDEPSSSVSEAERHVEGAETSVAAGTPSDAPQEEDIFSDVPPLDFSFEPEVAEPASASPAPEAPKKKEEQVAAFDFGDFDFEEETPAEKTGDKSGAASEKETWHEEKPASFAVDHDIQPSAEDVPLFVDEEPPLSISSRRRGGSVLPIAVIAFSVLLGVALVGGGYLFFSEGPAGLNRVGLGFVPKWFGLEAKEEGGIAIRNPAASFINNKEAGELFIVTGEAVNNFTKPRASMQVKASLYGPKGEVLQQKTAYCGNSLSREQLTTLPVAELEKLMANPFGDSLSNLAVQPGKAIPFVIVFAGVPKGAADFGIEVVGSTIASK